MPTPFVLSDHLDLDDGYESCGFCIFNTVAVAALHALEVHGHTYGFNSMSSTDTYTPKPVVINKVAIFDFDVHHGQGTEAIVKQYGRPDKLMFSSIHLYESTNEDGSRFYPGTGHSDSLPSNVMNIPIPPLWQKQKKTQIPTQTNSNHVEKVVQNIQLSDLSSNTATGHSKSQDNNSNVTANNNGKPTKRSRRYAGNDTGTNSIPKLSKGSVAAETNSNVIKRIMKRTITGNGSNLLQLNAFGRERFRAAVRERLLFAMRAFQPDLILLSAGFDGGCKDIGNQKHDTNRTMQGMNLQRRDFLWVTQEIRRIAGICCEGRIVSVLEGGYGSHYVQTAASTRSKRSHTQIDHKKKNNEAAGKEAQILDEAAIKKAKKAAELQDIYAGNLNRRDLADNCVQHVRGLILGI